MGTIQGKPGNAPGNDANTTLDFMQSQLKAYEEHPQANRARILRVAAVLAGFVEGTLSKISSVALRTLPRTPMHVRTDSPDRSATKLTSRSNIEGIETGQIPVPDRLTDWGLPPPSSLKSSVVVRAPVAVGLNVTLTVQLAPAPKVLPQVLV